MLDLVWLVPLIPAVSFVGILLFGRRLPGKGAELGIGAVAASFVLSAIALELTSSAGQPMRADTHLAQRIGGQADIRKVTVASLIDEAVTWGIRRRTASAVVTETLDQVLAAIPATPGDARVLAVIREQAERISRG